VVAASVSQIVNGLRDSNDSAVRTAAARTLGELSEQGGGSFWSAVALLKISAAFRSTIGASIPQIVDFLKDTKSSDIRIAGVRSLVILSEQGETSVHCVLASV
jgi:hypothetical protein